MMSSLQLQLPEWFVAGGVAMWLLAVLSVVALATLLTKMLQFARLRPVASKQADALLESLERGDTPVVGDAGRSPVDPVVLRVCANRAMDAGRRGEDSLRDGRGALTDRTSDTPPREVMR